MYGLVAVSALTQLLPASGIEPTKAHIAQFGGLLFTVFMLGWACSMFWGWVADRWGRIPAMCLTILFYSIFTGCCGLAAGVASFAVFRFLTGFGIGGEWAAGAPLLQESVPEAMRERLAGWLHTGTPIGFLLSGTAALIILPHWGWRGLFILGSVPAILALFLRLGVPESPKWKARKASATKSSIRELFTAGQAKTTWAAAGMLSCLIFGLWSSTFWIPTLVITWQQRLGATLPQAQQMGSTANLIMSVGTLVACAGMPWIVRWLPRRRLAATCFFIGSLICNATAYLLIAETLKVFWLFMAVLPFLGFFTSGVFSMFTIWLPELFPTVHRALGSGFAFSFGRIFGALGPTIVGFLAAREGSYPLAIATISLIYLVGLPFIAMAPETAGKALKA